MKQRSKARLVLADGTCFEGVAAGATEPAVGEVVFTTGMTGYQEVLTDPSYCGQIVTMTSPHIGNVGVNPQDQETRRPFVTGFVVHELSPVACNWRANETLDAYLTQHGIAAIAGVDTRSLTQHIRDAGAQMGAIGTEDRATLHDRAQAAPPMTGRNLTGEVTCPEPHPWTEGTGEWSLGPRRTTGPHVVAVDYGVKHSILRCLVDAGCRVTVVPAQSSVADIEAQNPDAIFLSNGPGDPAAVTQATRTVSEILGRWPLFGICLGHQIVSLALGASTYKLKFGHRGLNQPVKDLATGRVEVTSQNHGFVVDQASLEGKCEMTHIHLNDDTCEGISHPASKTFSVQYHPEASAGPHDARYLFDRFVDTIEGSNR